MNFSLKHPPKAPRIGLALGGGGARGLCHIAFVQALDEMGIRPSIISGTSIGSIIGAFYAGGMSGADLLALAKSVGLIEMGKMLDWSILSPSGLVKGHGVEEYLNKHLPACHFEDLRVPLRIVATDYWHREEVVFSAGPLISAIRASISIPGLFEPVKIDGHVLVDGGAVNPLPISVIRPDCDILIAIDVSGTNVPPAKKKVPSMFDSVMATFQLMETSITHHQMAITPPDIYIKPRLENVNILDFHRDEFIINSVDEDVLCLKQALREAIEDFHEKKRGGFLRKWKRQAHPCEPVIEGGKR